MAQVKLTGTKKTFGIDTVALHKSDLSIKDREFMVLVGPSGCGKSTTLRLIAGLEHPDEGTIEIGDLKVNDIAPKDRDIAMVFQNYALYPHMTAYQNMAFGLKLRKYQKDEIDKRVREAATILGIEELLERRPKALSGGQMQRVALGRAIVREPSVFLLDEPLSNLDAKLRVAMRKELKLLHRKLKTTMIYVTHDQVEAMTLGDRICVLKDGHILQVGTPLEVYNKPVNRFVAGFIGTPPINFFNGNIAEEEGAVVFQASSIHFSLDERLTRAAQTPGPGSDITFGIRPEDISLLPKEPEENFSKTVIQARVEVIENLGHEQIVYCSTGGNETFIVKSKASRDISAADTVYCSPDMDKAHIFDSTGKNISLS